MRGWTPDAAAEEQMDRVGRLRARNKDETISQPILPLDEDSSDTSLCFPPHSVVPEPGSYIQVHRTPLDHNNITIHQSSHHHSVQGQKSLAPHPPPWPQKMELPPPKKNSSPKPPIARWANFLSKFDGPVLYPLQQNSHLPSPSPGFPKKKQKEAPHVRKPFPRGCRGGEPKQP